MSDGLGGCDQNRAVTDTQPGWYPDPYLPDALRWHDGSSWTMHSARRTTPPPPPQHPVTPGWFTLTRVVQALLGVAVVVDVWSIADSLHSRSVFERWRRDPMSATPAEAQDVDRMAMIVSVTSLVVFVVCGVLFITWLFKVHRSSDLDRARMEHDSAWAIAGWFVPILSLWRPLGMVQDVLRGATGQVYASMLAVGWWLVFLASLVFSRFVTLVVPAEDSDVDGYLDTLITRMNLDAVGAAVEIVAAVLAALTVQQVASAVRRRLAAAAPVPQVTGG